LSLWTWKSSRQHLRAGPWPSGVLWHMGQGGEAAVGCQLVPGGVTLRGCLHVFALVPSQQPFQLYVCRCSCHSVRHGWICTTKYCTTPTRSATGFVVRGVFATCVHMCALAPEVQPGNAKGCVCRCRCTRATFAATNSQDLQSGLQQAIGLVCFVNSEDDLAEHEVCAGTRPLHSSTLSDVRSPGILMAQSEVCRVVCNSLKPGGLLSLALVVL
jgi:hypothetical protein